jgi:ribonuclease P protein component
MIPAAYRLKLGSRQTFRGKKHSFPWGMIITAPSPSPQWAISVTKKAAPLAVTRNKIRRQITQHLYTRRHFLDQNISFLILVLRSEEDTKEIISQACSLLCTGH